LAHTSKNKSTDKRSKNMKYKIVQVKMFIDK